MERGEGFDFERFAAGLSAIANWVIRIVGSVIFAVLLFYAFRYTQYMNPGGAELPVNVPDSMTRNILFLGGAAVFLFGLFWLETKVDPKVQVLIARGVLLLTVVWVLAAGFWWITAVDRVPEGDQAFIYGGASYFLEGKFFFLEKGGYCDIYPHQLSLIFLTELLFRLVGAYNYFAFQAVCVVLSAGIVCLGYALVRQLTEHAVMAVGYCVLMAACLPMIFYTGWVYGEIPSVFFVLLASNLLVAYERKGRARYLVGVVVSYVLAVMVRQNSWIFVIAFTLVGCVWLIKKWDYKVALALLLSLVLPLLVGTMVEKMYEIRSGMEVSEGLPAYSHIAMGLQENNGTYGWYSQYCKEVYYSVDCVPEFAAHLSKEDIATSLSYMKENPEYGRKFFKEKILSQWNGPLYQSLYFASKYAEGKAPEEGTWVDKINNEYFVGILGFCDGMQFVIYAGILCYFLFAVKKDSSLLAHLCAVGIIGGFFFSIMWEAKTRYILPYYLTMFPLAVIGYRSLFYAVINLANHIRTRKDRDNIIEFKQVA